LYSINITTISDKNYEILYYGSFLDTKLSGVEGYKACKKSCHALKNQLKEQKVVTITSLESQILQYKPQ
jgi:hypothetical protein